AAQAAILLEAEAATRLRLGGSDPAAAEPILRLRAPRQGSGVVAHSLGMIAESAHGSRYTNSVLLPRDKPVPSTETRPYQFHLSGDGTDLLEVFLTQGEVEDPERCVYLGRYVVTGFPTGRRGGVIIDVSYAYDDSALVGVSATDRATGTNLGVK